jgi:hypothetical protein
MFYARSSQNQVKLTVSEESQASMPYYDTLFLRHNPNIWDQTMVVFPFLASVNPCDTFFLIHDISLVDEILVNYLLVHSDIYVHTLSLFLERTMCSRRTMEDGINGMRDYITLATLANWRGDHPWFCRLESFSSGDWTCSQIPAFDARENDKFNKEWQWFVFRYSFLIKCYIISILKDQPLRPNLRLPSSVLNAGRSW